MAMNAPTGRNEGIEADIKEVQEHIGSVQKRESLLLEALSEEDINNDAAKRQSMVTLIQATKDKGNTAGRLIGLCMAVEARRQCQGQEDYDPSSMANEMKKEAARGKGSDRAKKEIR